MHLPTGVGIHLERYCRSGREAPSRVLVLGVLLVAVEEGGDEQADGDDPHEDPGSERLIDHASLSTGSDAAERLRDASVYTRLHLLTPPTQSSA